MTIKTKFVYQKISREDAATAWEKIFVLCNISHQRVYNPEYIELNQFCKEKRIKT